MTVTYVPFDGELVSREWSILLHDIRYEDHVVFHVNEGHRTMRRQRFFWDLYRFGHGNLAAEPSAHAPHIRTGRVDHAIDFNNAAGVINAAARRGVTIRLTVPGESWHGEADLGQLVHYADHHATRQDSVIRPFYVRPYRINDKQAVVRLQKLLRGLHYTKIISGKYGRWTRLALRQFQHRHGLKVDGIVGPGTWRALRKAQG